MSRVLLVPLSPTTPSALSPTSPALLLHPPIVLVIPRSTPYILAIPRAWGLYGPAVYWWMANRTCRIGRAFQVRAIILLNIGYADHRISVRPVASASRRPELSLSPPMAATTNEHSALAHAPPRKPSCPTQDATRTAFLADAVAAVLTPNAAHISSFDARHAYVPQIAPPSIIIGSQVQLLHHAQQVAGPGQSLCVARSNLMNDLLRNSRERFFSRAVTLCQIASRSINIGSPVLLVHRAQQVAGPGNSSRCAIRSPLLYALRKILDPRALILSPTPYPIRLARRVANKP
ncbi:hypothetical protein K438DRAFT_1997363 [Mycena galopus ATCC 62051]|nr:hypothetical protein K438DRAFT_1997363 [Mycena galopus ATCC 62051]